jgi:thiamine-phosphate pyrophosphorylase
LAALKKVVEKLSLPIYAIGGIKPENIADTRRTGVRGVALISAVMSAADPENATKEILKLFNR